MPRSWLQHEFQVFALIRGAVLVCAGCFVGSSSVGMLRFGGDGPAILFPPYAVLAAALLVSPIRVWWLYLLAASLGSLGPHLAISPTAQVVLAELANYTKAVVCAGGIRWVLGVSHDLHTLRQMGWFLVFAAGVGPLVGGFVGAIAATTFGGAANYWLVWRGWVLSNAITGITLLPVILLGVSAFRSRLVWPSPRRALEGVIVFAGLFAVSAFVFLSPGAVRTGLSSHMVWPLPLLLWAAVRFGAGGTSWALLVLSVVCAWGALGGRGPFAVGAPTEQLLELQFFLITTSLPLLLLSSLVSQQRRTAVALGASERETRRRLAQLNTIYRTAPVGLAFVDADLRYVNVSDDLARQNRAPGDAHLGRTLREMLPADMIDAIEEQYRRVINSGTSLSTVECHSDEGGRRRDWVVDYHPVHDDAGLVLGVNAVVQEVTARKEAEAVLRRSQQLSVAVLGSLKEHVAVLDGRGDVIAVNGPWWGFAPSGAPADKVADEPERRDRVDVGVNYLEVGRRAAASGDDDAARAIVGIQSVLNGDCKVFEMEYYRVTPWREWWFLMSVTPLNHAALDGAVVSHRDVTELKRAEETVRNSETSLRTSNRRAQELAGRLIHAQEAERSRIARELHDDVDQQLAAISLSLSALRRAAPADPRLQGELEEIQRQAIKAAGDVRQLSHQLHPGVLRHAGLTAALKSYCAEFRARHGIAVTFHAGEGVEGLMASAGAEVALCLYRSTQEALGNIARHSGARHVRVSLAPLTTGAGVELRVEDDGRGFDVGAAREAGGLGLLSIDERVRLVRGTATIDSRERVGTTVQLSIPLEGVPDVSADRAAGG